MNLSTHFTLEELTESDTALRLGIANIASPNIIANLKITADGLEKVRALLGKPIHISSGYRSPTLNRAVNGSATSAHVLGFAADFKCIEFGPPKVIVQAINASGIKYDQIINEGTWVHISFDPKMRNQALNATFSNGKATYAISD